MMISERIGGDSIGKVNVEGLKDSHAQEPMLQDRGNLSYVSKTLKEDRYLLGLQCQQYNKSAQADNTNTTSNTTNNKNKHNKNNKNNKHNKNKNNKNKHNKKEKQKLLFKKKVFILFLLNTLFLFKEKEKYLFFFSFGSFLFLKESKG